MRAVGLAVWVVVVVVVVVVVAVAVAGSVASASPARCAGALAGGVSSATARGEASAPTPAPALTSPNSPTDRTLEVNTASRARLESLGGVGPSMAAAILAARADGPFADWRDLVARVHGVGPGIARRLSARGLRVEGRAWPEPSSEMSPPASSASSALSASSASSASS